MNDDSDLKRLFAEAEAPAPDEAFVASVSARIRQQNRLAYAIPAVLALLLLAAIWATWPAAYMFSAEALAGIATFGTTIGMLANSQLGMTVALTLVATGLLWAWLFERFVTRD